MPHSAWSILKQVYWLHPTLWTLPLYLVVSGHSQRTLSSFSTPALTSSTQVTRRPSLWSPSFFERVCWVPLLRVKSLF
ncbi:hypothetical protein LB505_000259 [Fusarium chuoi]|nr:hypothetical protein LB505_000259 [Fusarium chuoi]